MPPIKDFDQAASLAVEGGASRKRSKAAKKRLAPFSIRLSDDDRARLAMEAAGAPLGAYIKSKILGSAPMERKRRKGLPIQDREALAQALALLGRADLTRVLLEMLGEVRSGSLAVTPETEAELRTAIQRIITVHSLVMMALGFKSERGR